VLGRAKTIHVVDRAANVIGALAISAAIHIGAITVIRITSAFFYVF
jgi:carbonic anhydrase/acetyltransferase-like protein (isoleucine patch superfamily)